jgi:hypothetical protein
MRRCVSLLLFVLAVLIFLLSFRSIYPIKYKEIIVEYSERYDIPPELISSIINAESGFASAQYDDIIGEGPRKPNVTIHWGQSNNMYVVIADGEEAIFVEFGAGVFHNGAVGSSPHPLGSENGYTIGSYGKGRGKQNAWGYIGEDGEVHITRGTRAQMPLYNATKSVISKIPQIAREVFG